MLRFLFLLLACLSISVAAPVINEVQSTNTGLADPFGQLMDWVEIYNPDGEPVNMQGYYLSDSVSDRVKYQFPNIEIAPGGFLVIWAGSVTDFPLRSGAHATFGISSGGEAIVLTAPDGLTVVDQYPSKAIGAGRSMGRQPDGTGALYFFTTPTQGTANLGGGTPTETLPAPTFSIRGGLLTSGGDLELGTGIEGGTIHYTTDGSDPTMSSPVYAGIPIPLTSRAGEANRSSAIPTNRDQFFYSEGWQAPDGEVFKINVVRARVFKENYNPSGIATQSYLVDPLGANRYSFPVVSINTHPQGLFSEEEGIYVAGRPGTKENYFQDWDRPGFIEFFEKDGTLAFQGDISVELHGNTSVSRPRKSLRITSRLEGGAPFRHQLFPEKSLTGFSTFLLRNSGNDWGQSMLRDALLTSLATQTSLDLQRSRPAVVFINGEYWGLHNVRERIDEGYYLRNHGLGESEFTQLDIHQHPEPLRPFWPIYDRGNPGAGMVEDFEDILNRAGANEFASAGSYDAIAERIDVANYIDYNVHQIFSGNTDWPGNNTRLWRAVTSNRGTGANRSHDGRWRWILFDTDFGLGLNFDYVPGWNAEAAVHAQFNALEHATSETKTSFSNPPEGTLLLRKLLVNPTVRNQFINRFADLLNTSLSVNRTVSVFEGFEAIYGPGIAEHVSRWRQPSNWSGDMNRIRTFLEVRPSALRGHIASKFGLPGTVNLTVDVPNPEQGAVTVNTIPIDATTVGVAANPYPWTGVYFQDVPVELTANPRPGFRFVEWKRGGGAGGGGVVASDAASSYDSWFSGSNGGTGFGEWQLGATTESRDKAGWFLNNTRGGWGLYANDEGTSSVSRTFARNLQIGDTFSVRIKPGTVSQPGAVGVVLSDSQEVPLFELRRLWWADTYEINGEIGNIPATTNVMDIEFTVTSASTYTARLTPEGGVASQVSGNLPANGNGTISRFQAYNYSAGNGGGADFFISSLQIAEGGNAGGGERVDYSTSQTVSVMLDEAALFEASFEREPATALGVELPAMAESGQALPDITVRALNSAGQIDAAYAGAVALEITGPNGYALSVAAEMVAGLATFTGIILPDAGTYLFRATSGELASAAATELLVELGETLRYSTLHSWTFSGDATTYLKPDSTIGGGALTAVPEVPADILQGTAQDFADQHLRVNNPLGKTLAFALPTTGFENIGVSYETRRSSTGAGEQVISYSLNGVDFAPLRTITIQNASPQPQVLDFSTVAGAANNANFQLRIAFLQGPGGAGGNNRFDNFQLTGTSVSGLDTNPADDEDSDGDGFLNLLERALAMNPLVADGGLPMAVEEAGGSFVFTYRVARNQGDLSVVPQFTSSLSGGWTDITTAPELVDNSHSGHQTYRVVLAADAGSGFARLRVMRGGVR